MPPEIEESQVSEQTQETAPEVDAVVNLKAEFNRKLGNLSETNARLEAQLAALAAALPKAAPAQTAVPAKKVSVFDDEEAFAASIEERVSARVDQVLTTREVAQAKNAQLIQGLISEFPELSDGSSDLTLKAVEVYNNMSADDKRAPLAYKAAVQQAALEMGVKPKSKRAKASSDESFSLGSGSGAAEATPRKQKSQGIDPRTKMFAEAVGLNLDDPKNKASAERIANNHGRKNYNKWA